MLDDTILIFFNQTLAHPWLDIVALALSLVGFALLPGLGLAFVRSQQHRRLGLAILAGLGVSLMVVIAVQFLAWRPRPETVRLIGPRPNFPSYPSGHAAAAFSTAIIIGLYFRSGRLWLPALGGAGLIALSRLYLGYHYPSDLLAGTVVGLAIGAAGYGLLIAAQPGRPGWPWLLWPQVGLVLLASQMAYLDLLPTRLLRWPGADKVLHFLLFGALAFWLNLWLGGRMMRFKSWSISPALLLLVVLATLDEAGQALSPLRSVSLTDLISNFLGLFFFSWLSRRLIKPAADRKI